MQLSLQSTPLTDLSADALVWPLMEAAGPDDQLAAVDRLTGGQVEALRQAGQFKGKPGETLVLYTPGGKVKRVVLVGLGKAGTLTAERLRNAAGKGTTTLRDLGVKRFSLAFPTLGQEAYKAGTTLDAESAAQAFAEGALLSLYQNHAFRTQDLDDVKKLEAIDMWLASGTDQAAVERGVKTAQVLAESIDFARELIVQPGNVLTPERMAEAARKMAAEVGLEVQSLDEQQLREKGFGCLLGVGQGSEAPPRFIVVEWRGGKPDERPIAVVGKGITFDTGGIGIKPGPGMEKMKYDMAGGASTLAILRAVAALGVKRNVVGLVAAAENMPSGTAIKPGDIVKSYAGLTVEVNDTDAEGRVVLSDALAYAVKDKQARAIIDMATLTGTVAAALGREVMGVMGNNEPLIQQILAAGERTGDRGWHLPIVDEYEEAWQSDIADTKNYGGRYGDAINAAGFLRQFVGETPWVHLDIAGVGWTDKDRPYRPKGPTGSPIRAVVEVLRNWQD